MAFTTENLVAGGEIRVIIKKDSAIDHELSDYDKYLETLDETYLSFKPGDEPTRFLMKKNIPLKHRIKIDNTKVKYEKSGDVSINLGSLMIETVRATLCGVENPSNIPQDKQLQIKTTTDGLLDEKQTEVFLASDFLENLYTARENYLKHASGGDQLKKG